MIEPIKIEELDLLFNDVQLNSVFADNKTFVDCSPKQDLHQIAEKYEIEKNHQNFDLKKFVLENFELPKNFSSDYHSDTNITPQEHINGLWKILTRSDEKNLQSSTLLKLPNHYVVPGGRFGEIYYWDSFFTMLGLQVSNQWGLIENMLDNFSYLIDKFGYIPNGNRTYFIGRSQPPFFALMVNLLFQEKGEKALLKFLPSLLKEYNFWMKGVEDLEQNSASRRVVKMPNGEILNRYWDENSTPRPESYREDIELAEHSENPALLWRNIRAACESGWDFSTRWFKNIDDFASIHTTDIVPIDLNCLLLFHEQLLEKAYTIAENQSMAKEFNKKWKNRKQAIQHYCWNENLGFYFDFDFVENTQKETYTLASVFPLYFGVSSEIQAKSVANVLENNFLGKGGLLTTLEFSGQQWDAPNGWAPLQYMAYKGLKNYEFDKLAKKIKRNWLKLNDKVYKNTGKFTEKYDVFHADNKASGGEYPNQDGFGWTNGVYLKLLEDSL